MALDGATEVMRTLFGRTGMDLSLKHLVELISGKVPWEMATCYAK